MFFSVACLMNALQQQQFAWSSVLWSCIVLPWRMLSFLSKRVSRDCNHSHAYVSSNATCARAVALGDHPNDCFLHMGIRFWRYQLSMQGSCFFVGLKIGTSLQKKKNLPCLSLTLCTDSLCEFCRVWGLCCQESFLTKHKCLLSCGTIVASLSYLQYASAR